MDDLVCVEYPGYVRDTQNMLRTLGGEKEISKAYRNVKNKQAAGSCLELRFRPNDPLSHPIAGRYRACPRVLGRIKVKCRKHPETGVIERRIENAEVIGVVRDTFQFDGLADFQILAQDLAQSSTLFSDGVLVDDFSSTSLDKPINMPSPMFASTDQPMDYRFRDNPSFNSILENGPGGKATVKEFRRVSVPARLQNFLVDESVETVPMSPLLSKAQLAAAHSDSSFPAYLETFAHRKVWSRLQLAGKLSAEEHRRWKQLLPGVAYYWTTGPFRTLWTAFGYDPRKNPEDRGYQILDIRIPPQLRVHFPNRQANRQHLARRLRKSISNSMAVASDDSEGDEYFKPSDFNTSATIAALDTLPVSRQIFCQIGDINDRRIVELLNVVPHFQYANGTGWLPTDVLAVARSMAVERVLLLLQREKGVDIGPLLIAQQKKTKSAIQRLWAQPYMFGVPRLSNPVIDPIEVPGPVENRDPVARFRKCNPENQQQQQQHSTDIEMAPADQPTSASNPHNQAPTASSILNISQSNNDDAMEVDGNTTTLPNDGEMGSDDEEEEGDEYADQEHEIVFSGINSAFSNTQPDDEFEIFEDDEDDDAAI